MQSATQNRVAATLAYSLLLTALQYFVIQTGLTPNENSIWFYNGVAGLLFGSRILNPYFTPPADAATNAFAALASLIAGALVVPSYTFDAYVLGATAAFCGAILAISLAVLLFRPAPGVPQGVLLLGLDRFVRSVGTPNVMFTIVILTCVWLFHRDRPTEVFSITAAWSVVTLLRPVEAALDFMGSLFATRPTKAEHVVGLIAAYQSPNIVLVRQTQEGPLPMGTPLLVSGDQGGWLLGLALNYVGRDEGNLLRVLTVPLPAALAAQAPPRSAKSNAHIALRLDVSADDLANVALLDRIEQLRGVVDKDSTLEFLQFEVIDERGLSEGRLVETRIGDQKRVLFQVVEGVTHEDIVQQKNKYGYARAKARKIGFWDEQSLTFKPVAWLPSINAPVFLVESESSSPSARAIGHFPGTNYGVSLDVSEAVTHNTASGAHDLDARRRQFSSA